MPFYQVLCIAAHNPEYVCLYRRIFRNPLMRSYSQRQIKGLVRLAATHILGNGGVVRGIQYWGTETLPQRMRAHGTNHDHGECVISSYVRLSIIKSVPATGQCISTRRLRSRKV